MVFCGSCFFVLFRFRFLTIKQKYKKGKNSSIAVKKNANYINFLCNTYNHITKGEMEDMNGRKNLYEKADVLSNSLFQKSWADLWTYERNYIVKLISKYGGM